MWCDKYRPQKINELILSPKDSQLITNWMKQMKKGEASTNCLFLYGSPGTGKTTLAYTILKQYNYDVIELNSSEHRTQKNIRNQINDILGKKNIVSMFEKKRKDIGIIMDEIDGLTSGERGSLTELIKILFPKKNEVKKDKQKFGYIKQNPFICISNTIDKKILTIKKKSINIEVKKPSIFQLTKLAERVLEGEGKKYDKITVDKIVKNCQSDIRKLLIHLEYYYSGSEIKNIDMCLQNMKKEIEFTHFEAAEKLLRKYYSIDVTRQISDANFNIVSMIIFENFIRNIIKNKKESIEEKMEIIQKIYDSFLDGDILDKEIYVNQYWILHNYISVDKCSLPSYLMNSMKNCTTLKDSNLKYSSLLNKSSLEFFNIKNKHDLIEKYTNNSQSIDIGEIARIVKDDPLMKKFVS